MNKQNPTKSPPLVYLILSVGKMCVCVSIYMEYLGSEDPDVGSVNVRYRSNKNSESYSFAHSCATIYGHVVFSPLLHRYSGRTRMLLLGCLGETLHAWHLSSPRDLTHICFNITSVFPIILDAPR